MVISRIGTRELRRGGWSCAGLGRASGPGLVTKLGGVAPQKPAERLGVLERQHRRHPAAQVLLEIGLVPADGDGYAGEG